MKEITVHMTVEITKIFKLGDGVAADAELDRKSIPHRIADHIKTETIVDDVRVIGSKFFIGDAKEDAQ